MAGTRIKKNDLVKVISGKHKGKTGKVQVVDINKNRIIVAGINIVSKAVKRKSQQEQGGIIHVENPIDISNVQVVSKGAPSRITYKMKDDKKVRVAKKTGEEI